jgi:hypothetical protein
MTRPLALRASFDLAPADISLGGASRANTDDGRLHGQSVTLGADTTVSLYADRAHLRLVAQGAFTGPQPASLSLAPAGANGLSATLALRVPPVGDFEFDAFLACPDDLAARQGGLDPAGFTPPGIEAFCEAAGRELLDWLALRGVHGRIDDLAPLAEPCACLALARLYAHGARGRDEPAPVLARTWRERAIESLSALTLRIAGRAISPFQAVLIRA